MISRMPAPRDSSTELSNGLGRNRHDGRVFADRTWQHARHRVGVAFAISLTLNGADSRSVPAAADVSFRATQPPRKNGSKRDRNRSESE